MLFIPRYIEQQLKRARYELDKETNDWCGWVPQLPGVYAQAATIEQARSQLAEVIEDYLIISLQKERSKSFVNKLRQIYAAA